MKRPNDYREALEYVFSFRGFRPSVPIPQLMLHYVKKLGVVDICAFPNIFIVSGTNGKGSTAAYLEALYLLEGRSTLVYSSPHVRTIRERLRIDGKTIERDLFLERIRKIYPILEEFRGSQLQIGSFEIITLIAFCLLYEFGRQCVGIFEVGIGGASDRTNIFHRKNVVITRIGFDHIRQFGSFRNLVLEKVSLCKPGDLLLTTSQGRVASQLIDQYCKLHKIERPMQLRISSKLRHELNTVLLPGFEQQNNFRLALLAYCSATKKGLHNIEFSRLRPVRLPGRWQHFAIGGRHLYADSAHNYPAIRKLLVYSRKTTNGPRVAIVAFSQKREYQPFIRMIFNSGVFTRIIFTKISAWGGEDPAKLMDISLATVGLAVSTEENLFKALAYVFEKTCEQTVIIFGSFRLMQDVEYALCNLKYQLTGCDELDPKQAWMDQLT